MKKFYATIFLTLCLLPAVRGQYMSFFGDST